MLKGGRLVTLTGIGVVVFRLTGASRVGLITVAS